MPVLVPQETNKSQKKEKDTNYDNENTMSKKDRIEQSLKKK